MANRGRRQRTQAERSAETQAALLDATIESLVELGYARTSTTEIAQRAGVSRGAQVHHYPTKADLVVAAIERVYSQQEAEFARRFAALPAGERTLPHAIDELWTIFSGPVYPAVLELVVAARTDAELQVVVQAVAARWQQAVSDRFAELFPELAEAGWADRLAGFAFAVLQGAAVSGYMGFARPDDAVSFLRSLAGVATPEQLSALEELGEAGESGGSGHERHAHGLG